MTAETSEFPRQPQLLSRPEDPRVLYHRIVEPIPNNWGENGQQYGVTSLEQLDKNREAALEEGEQVFTVFSGRAGGGKSTALALMARRYPEMICVTWDAIRRLFNYESPLTPEQEVQCNTTLEIGLAQARGRGQHIGMELALTSGKPLRIDERDVRTKGDRGTSVFQRLCAINPQKSSGNNVYIEIIDHVPEVARWQASKRDRQREANPRRTIQLAELDTKAIRAQFYSIAAKEDGQLAPEFTYLLQEENAERFNNSVRDQEKVFPYAAARFLQECGIPSDQAALVWSLSGPTLPRDLTPLNEIFSIIADEDEERSRRGEKAYIPEMLRLVKAGALPEQIPIPEPLHYAA